LSLTLGNFAFSWKYWGYCKNGKWLFLSPELFYMKLKIKNNDRKIKNNDRKLKK